MKLGRKGRSSGKGTITAKVVKLMKLKTTVNPAKLPSKYLGRPKFPKTSTKNRYECCFCILRFLILPNFFFKKKFKYPQHSSNYLHTPHNLYSEIHNSLFSLLTPLIESLSFDRLIIIFLISPSFPLNSFFFPESYISSSPSVFSLSRYDSLCNFIIPEINLWNTNFYYTGI